MTLWLLCVFRPGEFRLARIEDHGPQTMIDVVGEQPEGSFAGLLLAASEADDIAYERTVARQRREQDSW